MPAVISNRVKAGPRDRLPPGAAEAWFAHFQAKLIRAGLQGPTLDAADENASAVAFARQHGFCSVSEAADIMGIHRNTVQHYTWRWQRCFAGMVAMYLIEDVQKTAQERQQRRDARNGK